MVILAKMCILYDRITTHSDPRMRRLHPGYVEEQWVINRSGWALLVLTEVFHKQRRVGWGGVGVWGGTYRLW